MPRLMCMTRMEHARPTGQVTVDADAHLPDHSRPRHGRVVQLRRGTPRFPLFSRRRCAEGGYRMYQEDVERGQEFRKCIECFLCQDVCHVIRDHEENKQHFAGPRFFIRYRRAGDAPARHRTTVVTRSARKMHGLGYLQHHQVLHRGLP
jgi:succinate dehydrogenase / fumarate reductase iron-sulfur subunit